MNYSIKNQPIITRMRMLIFMGSVLFFSMVGLQVHAIGLITKPLVIDNALRGQVFEEELVVFNTEKEEVIYGLSAQGDISNWVRFYQEDEPIDQLKVPPRVHSEIRVDIHIPEDAPNGEYQGSLEVQTLSSSTSPQEGTAGVSQKIGREVTVTVTDQENVDIVASVSPASYTVKPGGTLEVNAFYYNYGNVSVRPDLQLKIIQEEAVIHNSVYPYPEGEDPVRPGGQKKISVNYNLGSDADGIYEARAMVLWDGEEVKEERFSFTVGEVKVLGIHGSVRPFKPIWFAYFGAGLIILISLFFFFKQRKII